MVNAVEKFLHVAFQNEAIACPILPDSTGHALKSIYPFMGAKSNTARKRCRNKGFFKDRIDYRKNGVVENPISDIRFMDMALFGIADIKAVVTTMAINSTFQATMKLKNILFKISLKLHDVSLIPLIPFKTLPRLEKIFRRNDAVKKVGIDFHNCYG